MKKPRSSILLASIKGIPTSVVRVGILHGLGITEKDLKEKALVAVVNSWNEVNPGHKHLNWLATAVKEGIIEAGGIPMEFCVIGPCDGYSNGTEGMQYVLAQRELIADSIECMVNSHFFDGMVTLSSCDKINPAMLMASARLDIPTICVPGGAALYQIRFDTSFKGIEQSLYSKFDKKLQCARCDTSGACEIMGTAITGQCLMEALGMALPGAALIPAMNQENYIMARNAGKKIIELIENDIKPSQIMTREAFENAIMVDLAIGGSTNSTIHLPAIASELNIELPLELFNEFNTKIPTLIGVAPNGPWGAIDFYKAGGVPAILKRLINDLHSECKSVSGNDIGQIAKKSKILDPDIVKAKEDPFFKEGGTAILKGNLAPEGSVVKQSAVDKGMLKFEGKAVCFNTEIDALDALANNKIKEDTCMVLRYQGPKARGMPELLTVTVMIQLARLQRIALITDGRFSGATSGPCIGHITPEAFVGGPIGVIQEGDVINIDIPNRKLEINLSDRELSERLKNWSLPEIKLKGKYLQRYRLLVSSATSGAILKSNLR